jgi:hypothetical protein
MAVPGAVKPVLKQLTVVICMSWSGLEPMAALSRRKTFPKQDRCEALIEVTRTAVLLTVDTRCGHNLKEVVYQGSSYSSSAALHPTLKHNKCARRSSLLVLRRHLRQ